MTKVVGIESGKKPPEPDRCQFCGKEPACFALTCPRLERVEFDEAGDVLAVQFVVAKSDEPDPAA